MTKILLCLVACLCITNIAYSLKLEQVVESDALISALLSTRLGTDSRYKSLLQIQNAAYRMSERRLTAISAKLRTKLLGLLKIASNAKNTEKMNELLGQILYITFRLESKETIKKIITEFKKLTAPTPARKRRDLTFDDLFGPVFKELLKINGGVTLLFAVDTTGSMREEIAESKQIAADIVNEPRHSIVDYILSPFNDPLTGPVQYRANTEKHLILSDIQHLNPTGGGDCEELAFTGMQDALDYGPQFGSSMFVFTDAPPKDGSPANVQTLIDTASYDDIKISFFLNKFPCPSIHPGIDTSSYHQVASDTGGTVFTFKAGSTVGRRKRRALASSYSPFVASSLRGTSLIKSKPVSTSTSTTVIENFDIDDQISFVTVVVTAPTGSPSSVTLIDAAGVSRIGNTQENAIVFNVDNPVAGKWKLTYHGTYGYTISVAFKIPVAIDVRYFYVEKSGALTMVSRPMRGIENDMMINLVGGDNIKLSSLAVSLLKSDGSLLQKLRFLPITTKGSFKLKVKLTPPNESYRVRVTGVTKKGYAFERLTNQLVKSSAVVFKTIRAGDEHSVLIGSIKNRILTFAFVKETTPVTATFNVRAKIGKITSVRGGTGLQSFRRRKTLDIKYNAPTNVKYRGKTDHITIDIDYAGEITTHRLSVLIV